MKLLRNIVRCALLSGALWLVSGNSASAFTSGDAQTLATGYNNAFYQEFSPGKGRFRKTKGGGPVGNWQEAVLISDWCTIIDRTGAAAYKTMLSKLLEGFSSDYGTNWSSNGYTDDIMWMSWAYLKGYQRTGNTAYRTIAKNNFDMCYARAWDTNGGGGMWWNTSKTSKASVANASASIVAYNLYTALGDSGYLTKAKAINTWQRSNCFDEATGAVWDSPSSHTTLTYNQGIFAASCWFVGSTGGADKAISYMKNMGGTIINGYHIMPQYAYDSQLAESNATGILWATKYMLWSGTQSKYLGWLQTNAQAAWNVRRTSDNLSWCQWGTPLTNGIGMNSWATMASVVALQLVPPTQ